MEFHPIANIFPLLSEDDLGQLAADIKQHGQRDPVWLFEGKVLDGRNRSRACELAGVTPKTKEFKGTRQEAMEFVWSTNFHRRHLTSSQAAMALSLRKNLDATFAAEVVERMKQEAQEKKRDGGKSAGRGRPKKDVKQISPPKDARKSRTIVAKAHGTNATTVAKTDKILASHPELAQDILSGFKSVTQVEREIKKQEISKKVDWPDGKYRVIYADPPWSYGNTQPDYHTEQRDHYPVMPLKDICDLPVKDLALDDSVLFIWVTSPVLEESFQVIRAWGFKYKASFVWDKVKHNMGHYNSVRHEFLLVAVRGSCQPDVQKLFDSVLTEERTEHSKKPDAFYDIIETIYPHGKRIELFARNKRSGWSQYGHQSS